MNEAAAIKRQLLNFARGYLVVGERGLSLYQSDWGHFSPKHNISAPMLGVVNQFSILCHGSVAELDVLSKHGFSFFFLFLFHQMNGYKANPACIKPASLRSQNTKRFRQKSLSITFIDTNFYENHYGFRRWWPTYKQWGFNLEWAADFQQQHLQPEAQGFIRIHAELLQFLRLTVWH